MQNRPDSSHNVTTKKKILRTLFMARERLPDENPIKYGLAFYWYKDGPYSEVIEENLKMLVDDRKVRRSRTDKWETYSLVPERALGPIGPAHDNFMDEAIKEVRRIAGESADAQGTVRQVYERSAPTPWYVSYKLEFMPKFVTHCADVREGRESMYTPKQLLGFLEDAVLDFPTASGFLGIRMIFMDFAKILNAFLRWDVYRTRSDLLDELSGMCNDVWETFAYGVRVHHHDPYYERRVDGWRRMYGERLRELDGATLERTKKFDSIVADNMRLAPDVEDIVLHPERHTFTPLRMDATVDIM